MKKTIFITLSSMMLVAGISSCKKEPESNSTTGTSTTLTTEQLLTRKWKLTGLVNLADEKKYLSGILDLKSDKYYTNTFASTSIATQGYWSIVPDSLFLSKGIFSNGNLPHYKIKTISQTEMNLTEHYTLDNKDAIIEYHYTAIN